MIDFLTALNLRIKYFNSTLMENCEVEQPFLFVIGAPRSGTTVLAQVLTHCLDVSYICNLAARFWLAPLVGIRLAREVLGKNVTPGFSSDYAVTPGAAGVHEFGYFWRYWLRCESNIDIPTGDDIHRGFLRRTLANIQHELGRPVVMKGIWPAYVANGMNEILGGNAVWMNVERDFVDNCISILEGRRKRGSVDEWCCGWVPPEPEFSKLRALDDPYRQIAGQVECLRRLYRSIATVTVTLADLCTNPMAAIEAIRGDIPILREVPSGALKLRAGIGRSEDRARFEELL